MNFKNFNSAYKEKINQELGKFLDIKTRQAKKIAKDCEKLTEAVKEFTLRDRSKRIRALLVILGYQGFGGKDEKKIIKAASFIELIHSYLLIHDDIIDQDDLRRGKPTMHKYFEHSVKSKLSKDKSKLFGVSMAILAGDLCCSLGYEILMKAKFSNEAKARAIEELDNLIFNVIQGEALDIFAQLSKQTSNKEIYNIYKYKTARYSFGQPLRIGGILAGADESDLNKLSKFAIPLGIAFQIQDDLLGLLGEEKIIGKPAGSDLREGKKTIVLSLALERCDGKERKIIQSVLGGKDIDLEDINRVRNIVRKTGALRLCGELIRDYIGKSKKALNKIDNFDAIARSLLIELADYISNREY